MMCRVKRSQGPVPAKGGKKAETFLWIELHPKLKKNRSRLDVGAVLADLNFGKWCTKFGLGGGNLQLKFYDICAAEAPQGIPAAQVLPSRLPKWYFLGAERKEGRKEGRKPVINGTGNPMAKSQHSTIHKHQSRQTRIEETKSASWLCHVTSLAAFLHPTRPL